MLAVHGGGGEELAPRSLWRIQDTVPAQARDLVDQDSGGLPQKYRSPLKITRGRGMYRIPTDLRYIIISQHY